MWHLAHLGSVPGKASLMLKNQLPSLNPESWLTHWLLLSLYEVTLLSGRHLIHVTSSQAKGDNLITFFCIYYFFFCIYYFWETGMDFQCLELYQFAFLFEVRESLRINLCRQLSIFEFLDCNLLQSLIFICF